MINIFDLFYESIAKEAATGRVNCGKDYKVMYNVLFETKVNGKYLYKASDELKNDGTFFIPTLEINDMVEFNNCLLKYYYLTKEFYKDKIEDDEDYFKTIFTLLWCNACEEDFKNPITFINRYIDFINNKLDIDSNYTDIGYSSILDSNIEIALKEEPIFEETPYALYTRSTSNNSSFDFPIVRFGISDGKAYIYAVQQGKKKNNFDENYDKKIRRKLFKVNENFEKEENIDNIMYPEYLTGINPSALIPLTILFSILEKNNINEIVVPSFLPVRYNGKEISFIIKRNKLSLKNKSDVDLDKYFEELRDNHEEIQRNISDKTLRNFRRLDYNFDNINIVSLPFELDSNIHINLSEYNDCINPLLKELYELSSIKLRKL